MPAPAHRNTQSNQISQAPRADRQRVACCATRAETRAAWWCVCCPLSPLVPHNRCVAAPLINRWTYGLGLALPYTSASYCRECGMLAASLSVSPTLALARTRARRRLLSCTAQLHRSACAQALKTLNEEFQIDAEMLNLPMFKTDLCAPCHPPGTPPHLWRLARPRRLARPCRLLTFRPASCARPLASVGTASSRRPTRT